MVRKMEERTLSLNIFSTRDEMGKAVARDVAAAMKEYISRKGSINMTFAAAPSQDEFLKYLSEDKTIDWQKVFCFHLDEYVDLPRNHPNTFEVYLRDHIFGIVNPKRVYYIKELEGSPEDICQQYSDLIRNVGGLDIACIGIGENGHIAFNDPGSDLHDREMMRVVTLDEICIQQQYKDYKDHPNPEARYASLEDVPKTAFTLTVPALLSAEQIYVTVPGKQKAEAVRLMWEGPISSNCPSSALRMHNYVKFYFDKEAASLLSRLFLEVDENVI